MRNNMVGMEKCRSKSMRWWNQRIKAYRVSCTLTRKMEKIRSWGWGILYTDKQVKIGK